MKWYTVNDSKCEFSKDGNRILGRVSGKTYELTDEGFKLLRGVKSNPYMPDEIIDPLIMHAKMIPHHIAYAKEKAKRLKKSVLQRNGPFLPSEIKNVFSQHAKMLPHHIAYAKGAMQSRFGRLSSLED